MSTTHNLKMSHSRLKTNGLAIVVGVIKHNNMRAGITTCSVHLLLSPYGPNKNDNIRRDFVSTVVTGQRFLSENSISNHIIINYSVVLSFFIPFMSQGLNRKTVTRQFYGVIEYNKNAIFNLFKFSWIK